MGYLNSYYGSSLTVKEFSGTLTRRCSSNGSWEPVISSCIKDILKDIRETVSIMKERKMKEIKKEKTLY